MWTAFARSGLALSVLVFLMFILRAMLDPVIDFAMAGSHSDAASVQRVGSYFGALTLDNLVLLAAVGVGIYLLGRAASERRLNS